MNADGVSILEQQKLKYFIADEMRKRSKASFSISIRGNLSQLQGSAGKNYLSFDE
jgi:hypothetical protein